MNTDVSSEQSLTVTGPFMSYFLLHPSEEQRSLLLQKLIQPLDMRGFSDFITACKVYRSLVRRLI